MVTVGIDPGKSGALVRITDFGQEAIMMPLVNKDVDAHAIAMWLREQRPDRVVIEKVGSRPGQGVVSMFTFGRGTGKVIGVLEALAIPYKEVTPQGWKKAILAGTTKDKQAAIDWCNRTYPDLPLIPKGKRKEQDGIADAACMAEYARLHF